MDRIYVFFCTKATQLLYNAIIYRLFIRSLTMASADSWTFSRTSPSGLSLTGTACPFSRLSIQVSPGNAHLPSRLCLPHLLTCLPVKYPALEMIASSPGISAYYAVPVCQASVLPSASSRLHLTVETLAARLMVPLNGPIADLHRQVNAPCRAHN